MTEWKSSNDGYCAYCGKHTGLHQPRDWGKSKSKKWICRKCLKSHFGIDIETQKTTWGEIVTSDDL